jgi:hypothetical protein
MNARAAYLFLYVCKRFRVYYISFPFFFFIKTSRAHVRIMQNDFLRTNYRNLYRREAISTKRFSFCTQTNPYVNNNTPRPYAVFLVCAIIVQHTCELFKDRSCTAARFRTSFCCKRLNRTGPKRLKTIFCTTRGQFHRFRSAC